MKETNLVIEYVYGVNQNSPLHSVDITLQGTVTTTIEYETYLQFHQGFLNFKKGIGKIWAQKGKLKPNLDYEVVYDEELMESLVKFKDENFRARFYILNIIYSETHEL